MATAEILSHLGDGRYIIDLQRNKEIVKTRIAFLKKEMEPIDLQIEEVQSEITEMEKRLATLKTFLDKARQEE